MVNRHKPAQFPFWFYINSPPALVYPRQATWERTPSERQTRKALDRRLWIVAHIVPKGATPRKVSYLSAWNVVFWRMW